MNESKIDTVNPAVIFESLSELETIIDRGKQVFAEVGTALMKIRINRLYQSEYDTFDEYCQKHWGFNFDEYCQKHLAEMAEIDIQRQHTRNEN